MKKFDELTFADDFIFCKVLTMQPELCRELLEMILEKKIEKINFVEAQKTLKETYDGKGVRFDVYVENDGKTEIYDIEMQTTAAKNLPKRSRYYQGMIDMDTVSQGMDYKQLKKSYVIFICLNDLFGEGRHIYSFENRCIQQPELMLKDEAMKIFLCADGTLDDVDSGVKKFLDFVAGKAADSELTRKLDEAVDTVKSDSMWRKQFMTLEMKYNEYLEQGLEQGLQQGLQQGLEQGLQQGLEQGLEQGLQQGLEQGKDVQRQILIGLRNGRSCEDLVKDGFTEKDVNAAYELYRQLIG